MGIEKRSTAATTGRGAIGIAPSGRAFWPALIAMALLTSGILAGPAAALVFTWGSTEESKGSVEASLSAWSGEETGWEQYDSTKVGSGSPLNLVQLVSSEHSPVYAQARSYIDDSSILVAGEASVGDGEGNSAASAFAGEIVPFSVSDETAKASGGLLVLDGEIHGAEAGFLLGVLDTDLNLLASVDGYLEGDFHETGDLSELYDFQSGEDYYLFALLEGSAYAQSVPSFVDETSSSFSASLTWGRSVEPVPEPGTWALLASGLMMMVGGVSLRRRRRS